MAYFDDTELIDLIRHGFALDDDTGLCTKILDRSSRQFTFDLQKNLDVENLAGYL